MIDYRLTVDVVDSMKSDTHLINLGRDKGHTHINRNMNESEYVGICFYETGYIVASTNNNPKGVVVAANVTIEDFAAYARKYDGENTPEQIEANIKALSGFSELLK